MSERVSDKRLAEMLAGLEGLPVGPWHAEDNEADLIDGKGRWLNMDHDSPFWHHIARCDPSTMRSIITELQQRRASVAATSQDLLHAVLSMPHEITSSEIILRAAKNEPGNATAQLHSALTAALSISHKSRSGSTLIADMTDEEFERDCSDENPNAGERIISHETGDDEVGEIRAKIVSLPIFTLKDPDDAYGVNSVDYIPRKEVLAILTPASTDETQGVKREPVAWLWECISGPYKGEIEVHSQTGIDNKEAARISHIYGAPFAVVRLSHLEAVEQERDELNRKLTIEWTRAREFLNRAETDEVLLHAMNFSITVNDNSLIENLRSEADYLDNNLDTFTGPISTITALRDAADALEAQAEQINLLSRKLDWANRTVEKLKHGND